MRAMLRAAPSVTCVAIAPPAIMCADLAAQMRTTTTSVVLGSDLVPRFSLANLAALRREVLGVDWLGELKSSALELEYVQVGGVGLVADPHGWR